MKRISKDKMVDYINDTTWDMVDEDIVRAIYTILRYSEACRL